MKVKVEHMGGNNASLRDPGEPSSAAEAYNLGILLRQIGQDPAAEVMLRRAVGWDDADVSPRAAASLALLLLERGDVQAALATYHQALDSGHPEAMPNAAFNIGVIRLKQGDVTAAEAAYNQAIESGHPHWGASAAFNLGMLLQARGDLDHARAALERAVAIGGPSGEQAAQSAAAELETLEWAQGRQRSAGVPSEPGHLGDTAAAEEREKIDAAIENAIRVISRTPEENPELTMQLNTLGAHCPKVSGLMGPGV